MGTGVFAKNFLGDYLQVIEGDYIGEIIRRTGAFSKRELFMLASIFSCVPLRNCLEIGANIGNHTSLFSRFFENTYAFEPNPIICGLLENNIQQNRLRATSYTYGVSNEAAELLFYVNKDNMGASSFVESLAGQNADVIKAHVVIGDCFIEQHHIQDIDYIKIDAEGFEGKVIKGLEKTIRQYQPIISLEWNCTATRNDFQCSDIFGSILKGYAAYAITKPFPKEYYSGFMRKLQRFMLRHIAYHNQKLALGHFYKEKNYDMIVLFPQRFSSVPHNVVYAEDIRPYQRSQ